jgi:uncharacterized membrane protein
MPEISAFCPACGRSVDVAEPATNNFRDKILGALAYFVLLPAIAILIVPQLRRNEFLRFHAWQSVLFTAFTAVLALFFRLLFIVVSIFPTYGYLLGWLTAGIGALGIVMLWVVLVLKALQGDSLPLPFLGPMAGRFAAHAEA